MPNLTEEEIKLLNSLSDDIAIQNYFFSKASNPKWFFPLKEKGYFSPTSIPQPQPAKEKGSFFIQPWKALPFLEMLSFKIKDGDFIEYAEPLLDVVNEITIYRTESGDSLSNYDVWWGFTKILLNLPNSEITKYLSKQHKSIKDWLDVWMILKFRSGIAGTDIATKLLPKFLTEDSADKKIAEDIVDAITQIVWLPEDESKKGYFFRKKVKAGTPVEDYWLIESFKKNSMKIGELCSKETVYLLAHRLKQLLNADRSETRIHVQHQNSTYRLNLERVKISPYVYSDFDYVFQLGIISLEDAKQAGEDPFKLHDSPSKSLFELTLKNQKYKDKFCQIVIDEIKKSSLPADIKQLPDLEQHLPSLFDSITDDYLYVHLKSLNHNPHVGYTDIEVIFLVLLRDVLKVKCESDVKAGKEILEKFISEEFPFPTFQRLFLFVLISAWSQYKEILFKFIDRYPTAFYESSYEVELFNVLKTHSKKFKLEEKNKIKEILEKGANFIEKIRKEKAVAYWKQKWYSAFLPDTYFQLLFDEEKKKTKQDNIEPPSENEVETVWVGPGKSPLKKDEILGTSISDLINIMNNFHPTDRWGDGFTIEGFVETIKLAVKDKPEKFVEGLSLFVTTKTQYRYDYLHAIVEGLKNAWEDNRDFNVLSFLREIQAYAKNPEFIVEAKKSQGPDFARATHFWIINTVADFIKEIVNKDEREVSSDLLDVTEKTLDSFVDLLPKNTKEDENYVSRALNTSSGRCASTIICLALRRGRIAKSNNEEFVWNTARYEALFKNGIEEAYTIFGQYIPNCIFLNKDWTKQKIKEFESLPADSPYWQGFMEGYLFYGGVYGDLYEWMRSHYEKAVVFHFENKRGEKLLVQHICVGYLIDKEDLTSDQSLFRKLLAQWDYIDFQGVVNFFWSEARKVVEKKEESRNDNKSNEERLDAKREKILSFWRWTYSEKELIKENLKEHYENFLSNLSRLAVILTEINEENFKWLELSSHYVDLDFNSAFFIEYLDKFTDRESLAFVAKLYSNMLKQIKPTYDQKHIESIVEKLFQNGFIEEAKKICDLYGERGVHFLRPIYNRYVVNN